MKKLIYAIIVLGVLGGILVWAKRPVPPPDSRLAELPAKYFTETNEPLAPAAEPGEERIEEPQAVTPAVSKPAPLRPTPSAQTGTEPVPDAQLIGTLVSSQTTFAQRQAIWKQLVSNGKLNEAISALERRIAENPQAPVDLAALGHAYFLKTGMTEDYGERASLGLKIDQTLDQSLKLDPNSWEARYDKAVSMSYWPSYLGKDKEVVEGFLVLIQRQESQAQEPQFAQTYIKLGEQYQKLGHAEYAQQIWQRGAGLFPVNEALQKRLVQQ